MSSRRYGHPRTTAERRERHKKLYGKSRLPRRGTGLKKKPRYRVYCNYGKGDTNRYGFNSKKDAMRMLRICRKHKNLKWSSIKKIKK